MFNTILPFKEYTTNNAQTFFGYYDKIPFNANGSKLLAISVDCENRQLKEPIVANIGYFYTGDSKRFVKLDETSTWCWQQGCRLMWHPQYPSDRILYNRVVDHDYGSIVYDLRQDTIVREYEFPIYDIDSQGKKVASLNFSRLGRLRPGYGYINFEDTGEGNIAPDDDGVWIYDLESNEKHLIVTLHDLLNFEPSSTMRDAEHYVNHLCFNPSGKRLLFFHIWFDGKKRHVRGLTCDINGQNLFILNEGRLVSHYTWKNDHELLLTGEGSKGFGYFLIDIRDPKPRRLSGERLNQDGHPSFLKEGEMFLTDTYPNQFNYQSLNIVGLEGTVNTVVRVYSPSSYKGEYRCDLHPRLSNDSSMVCVDVPGIDGRKLAVIKLDDF